MTTEHTPIEVSAHAPAIAALEAHASRLRASIDFRAATIDKLEDDLERERRDEQLTVAELVRIQATIEHLQAAL